MLPAAASAAAGDKKLFELEHEDADESEVDVEVTSWVVDISRPRTNRLRTGLNICCFISRFANSLLVSGGGRLEKASSVAAAKLSEGDVKLSVASRFTGGGSPATVAGCIVREDEVLLAATDPDIDKLAPSKSAFLAWKTVRPLMEARGDRQRPPGAAFLFSPAEAGVA